MQTNSMTNPIDNGYTTLYKMVVSIEMVCPVGLGIFNEDENDLFAMKIGFLREISDVKTAAEIPVVCSINHWLHLLTFNTSHLVTSLRINSIRLYSNIII